MFTNDWYYPVDPLMHLLDVFDQVAESRGLFFPGLPGHVNQSSRSLSKNELERGEASRGLRGFSDDEEYVGVEEIPVLSFSSTTSFSILLSV